jgi:endoglucanase
MKETRRPPRDRRRGFGRMASLLLALLTAVGLVYGTAFAAPSEQGTHAASAAARTPVPRSAMDAVAAMQPSWNLGNTLDAIPDETSWGNPLVTKATLDKIRDQGFRSVRIPVTWGNDQSTTAPYRIDPAFMSRVRQVVDWALADDLYVVLNVHHDSWQWINKMDTDHDQVLARYNAIWNQVATEFRNHSRKLLFESINEPVFDGATDARKAQLLDELNTSFHRIVRHKGGKNATRLLVLPTQVATPDQRLMDELATTMKSLRDPNLVATLHYYSFWPFSVNIAGFTRFDSTVQKDMTDTFARMHDTFVAKGVPVYLGEYGLLGYPDHTRSSNVVQPGEALKYFEAIGHEARVNGVTTALWDPYSLLNRETLQWRDPGLFAQIKSSWTTRSGTASSDTVYLPKSRPITSRTLTLNLNGTTFKGLWHGDARLVEDTDYRITGDRLTLTAVGLTRLTGDREYGVNATLQARFSSGLPWQIHVTTYDTPVLSDATGTTGDFTVPTRFRGDMLSTMEATYADGTNAGPADWTAYKQYGTAFSPEYGRDAITLTPDFFKEVRDGAPVTLTFHFWSGETVTYHVTKSGDSVTGTAS